jgi:DNA-binding transcriptional ArsR family regulator
MTDIFDAIADPTRRGILQLLRDRLGGAIDEVGVPEFVEELGVTRQAINRHLVVLADAGLVIPRDEGTVRTYSLDTTPFEELEDWLGQFVGLSAAAGVAGSVTGGPVPEAADGSTVFSAWSGADVGETIGRALAERSYQARSAIREASEKLPRSRKKRRGRG